MTLPRYARPVRARDMHRAPLADALLSPLARTRLAQRAVFCPRARRVRLAPLYTNTRFSPLLISSALSLFWRANGHCRRRDLTCILALYMPCHVCA